MAKENYKKQNKNLECQVCGFSFTVYGEVGKDYIEAHHTIPVSQMTGKSKTKIEDIALVCSNCHKMLHRKRPWLKMSEIKSLLLALKHSV
ncbi:MAG: HNH endonuclease [Leptospiraceae bacterium]|nr:HNH endonuclease [Leptospiraceae bacterium]